MKILVLGHRGMLGSMVADHMARAGHRIATIDGRFDWTFDGPYFDALSRFDGDLIVNCVGAIKQKSSDPATLYQVNGLFPLHILDRMKPEHFLIHPSTDCVFSGTAADAYRVDAPCDATDDYGRSKRLGELALQGQDRAAIFRVSIIGPEPAGNAQAGLMGWFLSQPEKAALRGFTNHYWNGVTTLEWVRFVEGAIATGDLDRFGGRITQLGTEAVHSKYDLLVMMRDIFRPDISVTEHICDEAVNRALVPDIASPPIHAQLRAIAEAPPCRR